mgnify:FL=1
MPAPQAQAPAVVIPLLSAARRITALQSTPGSRFQDARFCDPPATSLAADDVGEGADAFYLDFDPLALGNLSDAGGSAGEDDVAGQ